MEAPDPVQPVVYSPVPPVSFFLRKKEVGKSKGRTHEDIEFEHWEIAKSKAWQVV